MSRLSDTQRKVIAPRIRGREVHDLGAGDCSLSLELVRLGASSVVAVDKEPMPLVSNHRVTQVQLHFDCLSDEIDVAFVSWPINHVVGGLLALVKRANTVVYLGKNTDGSMCGWPGMFEHLAALEILDFVPERKNTLIVYRGEKRPRGPDRVMVGEEAAALSVYNREPMSYEEAKKFDAMWRIANA